MKSKRVISSCTIVALLLSSSPKVIKVSAASVVPEKPTRVWGKDRYETSVKISKTGWEEGSDYLILASGEGYADALSAAPLAKAKNAPILLTEKDSLNDSVLEEIKRLNVKHIIIIGGEGSVSKNVEDTIKSQVKSDIQRIWGKNRYETAVMVAEKLGKASEVIIASGENYPDALSAAPAAAIKGIPVLLSEKNKLSEAVDNYIKSNGITKIYVVGGTASISEDVEKSLPSSERLGGADRYETNKKVIERFNPHFDYHNVYLALADGPTGKEFADALSGSAIAGKQSAPIILTDKILQSSTESLLRENILPTSDITVLGGALNIPDSVVKGVTIEAEFFNKKGETYSTAINGNVDIKDDNITVKGDISGNLYIEGNNAVVSNITVNGTVYVNPGEKGVCSLESVKADKIVVLSGENVKLKDIKSKILNLQSRNTVNVHFENCEGIENTAVLSSAVLESMSGSFGAVKVADVICNDDPVEFRGTFDKTLTICGDANVNIASGATIYNIILPSNISERNARVNGTGKVGNIYNLSQTANLNIGSNISILGTLESTVKDNIKSDSADIIKKLNEKAIDKMSPLYTLNHSGGSSSSSSSNNDSDNTNEKTAVLKDEVYLDDSVSVALGKTITQADLQKLSISLVDSNNNVQSVSALLSGNGQTLNVNAPSNGYDIGENYQIIVKNANGSSILDNDITKSFSTLKAYTIKNHVWTFAALEQDNLAGISAQVVDSKGTSIPVNVSVDGSKVSVSPKDAYKENENYVLYMKSSSGKELKSIAFKVLEDKIENKIAYTYPGIFLMGDIDEDVTVKSDDVMLIGSKVTGSVLIAEEVGEGTVKLRRIIANGILKVKAGGAHSIHVMDCSFGKLIIDDEKNIVRVVTEGSTSVGSIEMKSGGTLKINDGSLAATADVSFSYDMPEGATVILDGNFGKVTSEAANININLASGNIENLALNSTANVEVGNNTSIGKLDINETAGSSKIDIADAAAVTQLNVQASTNVTGNGTVEAANINAGGTVFEKKAEQVEISSNIGVDIDDSGNIVYIDYSAANVSLVNSDIKTAGVPFNLNVTEGKNAAGEVLAGPVNVTIIGNNGSNDDITISNNKPVTFVAGTAVIPLTVMGSGTYALKVIIRGVAGEKIVSNVVVNQQTAPPLVNGLSFVDALGMVNDGKTVINLGAPSDSQSTFVYKVSDNGNAVSTPNVGDKLAGWQAVVNEDIITAANGKHIGVAEINSQRKVVQFSDGQAVVGEDEFGDQSAADVRVAQDGEKLTNTAFNLSVSGAKNDIGEDLSGAVDVTVTANGITIANQSVTFTGGSAIIPVTILNEGTYVLRVTISGVTGTKLVSNILVKKPVSTAVIVDSGSVTGATAGDVKITGLTAGRRYKATVDGTVWYVTAGGTLSINKIDSAFLTGIEIISLTNGKTYKVEEYVPEAVIISWGSVGGAAAGDSKITGLTAEKKYKVTVDGSVKYVTANGTLSDTEADATSLTGTQIIGLVNGKSYKVEEYIPVPTAVIVAAGSAAGATAGDSKIIGLTSGNKYKVIIDGAVKYVTANGTLSDKETDFGALIGTEITGLVNGKTYKVKENAQTTTVVSSIAAINNINVANGTAVNAIGLPSSINITLSDNTTTSAVVIWDNGSPAYSGGTAGSYTFTGTITLPSGVTNPTGVKATANVIVANPVVQPVTVSSVVAISNINVANGTTASAIGLPNTVDITLSDNTTISAAVTWDSGNPPYDGSVAGSYIFTGVISLPTQVANPNGIKATANVIVAGAIAKTVSSVEVISDINVANGTTASAIGLPSNVNITLSDNTTVSAGVTWDSGSPAYNGNTAESYTFKGTITLPAGVTNPNGVKATVNVVVADPIVQPTTVSSVAAISSISVANGTTASAIGLPGNVNITLSDNSVVSAGVTWDSGSPAYNGNAAGNYTFKGIITLPTGITNPNGVKATVNVVVADPVVQPKTVSSVATVSNISVANGTTASAIGLPGNVNITLSDNTTTSAGVTWDGGNPTYNGNTAGSYTFKGTITLPTGITNPNGVKATVNVVVADPIVQPTTVSSVATVSNINVANGTTASAIGLPSNVNITLSDNSVVSAGVTWDSGNPTYNGGTAGSYTFKGTITLPTGITNPNEVKATVNVVVADPDTTAPVIAPVSNADITVSAVGTWIAPTAAASDNVDGNISGNVVVSYSSEDEDGGIVTDLESARVHLGTAGNTVKVTYSVADAAGNQATAVSAIFTAMADPDTTAPVIAPVNGGNITASEVATWTAPSATASDNVDGDISENVVVSYSSEDEDGGIVTDLESARVHLGTAGNTVKVTYSVADAAGNQATAVSATFTAVADADVTAPVIGAVSGGNITASEVAGWTAPTATASDNVDGTISVVNVSYSSEDTDGSSVVDLATAKAHLGTIGKTVKVTYSVADAAGNQATAVSAIFTAVADADTTAPVIIEAGVSGISSTGAMLNFTSDEVGTYYYLVLGAGDSAPDVAAVEAQGTAVAKGTSAAQASANGVSVTGLTASTGYKAYVVVKDAAGNVSTVSAIEFTTTAANTAPTAANVSIIGTAQVGSVLTGSYSYGDADSDAEGATSFKWYRSDDASGANKTEISGATSSTYTLVSADQGKYISFEVTPAASTGVTTGSAVESTITGPVAANVVIIASGSVSGITAGDAVITGLTAGKCYKITQLDSSGMEVAIYYTMADGSLTPMEDFEAPLNGGTTQIGNLVNGTTYRVEEVSLGSWDNVGMPSFSDGGAYNICLYSAMDGQLYVAYTDEAHENKATVKRFNGNSWEDLGTPGFSDGSIDWISLYVDTNGVPYVAYKDAGNAVVKSYSASSNSWTDVGSIGIVGTVKTPMTQQMGITSAPNISLLGYFDMTSFNTIQYVAYIDAANADGVTVKKRMDGATWQDVGLIPSSNAKYVISCVDNNGVVYVAYSDDTSNGIALKKCMDGVNWEDVGTINLFNDINYISLHVSNDGTPYVAYDDFSSATVMKYSGFGWDNIGSVGMGSFPQYMSLSSDAAGIPYIAYSGMNSATVMKYNMGSWKNVGTPTVSEGPAAYTSLYVTNNIYNETPYVAYSDQYGKVTVKQYAAPANGITASVAPESSPLENTVTLTVTSEIWLDGSKFYYRVVNTNPTEMSVGSIITPMEWNEIDTQSHDITAMDGQYVEVVQVTSDNKIIAWGKSGATNDGYIAPKPTVKVSNLTLTDTDVDAGQMGGTLIWSAPADETNVTAYKVYASTDGTTKGAQIGVEVPVGTNQLVIPENTVYAPYLIVVASNGDGEAAPANYASVGITDVKIPTVKVSNLAFTDTDTDINELGGTLTWSAPADETNVTAYKVYASTDETTKGAQIGVEVPVGTNQLVIPENTVYAPYLIVVASNGDGEAAPTNYASVGITDVKIPTVKVSDLAFTDTDTDINELGGTLTWSAPADETNVTAYKVYASTDGTTKGAQIGAEVPVGTNQLVILENTAYAPYLIVVASNGDGEAAPANYASVGVTDVAKVIVESGSVTGATAGDTKITGLTPGTVYKVTVNISGTSTVMYTRADGTLTPDAAQKEALVGNEITGLTNGLEYKIEMADTTAPIMPPGIPVINFNVVPTGEFMMNWMPAVDDVTIPPNLRYKVVRAATPTLIDTVDKAEAITGPDVVMDWTTGIMSANTGIPEGVNEYFTVLVEDEAGNKSIYAPAASAVLLEAGSVQGILAGNGRITGLTPGKCYKVTVDGAVKYVTAAGILSDNVADAAPLGAGVTEITNLTNGTTYKVEVNNVVYNTRDDGSYGSLRKVIEDAASGDTITFAIIGNDRTITLANHTDIYNKNVSCIDINKDIKIIGPSDGSLTISGDGKYRIFNIGSDAKVEISYLNFTGGTDNTNTYLDDPDDENNYGGAIHNAGNLTINYSTFDQNNAFCSGGAITSWEGSTLKVNNSTFSKNNAGSIGSGGAIYAYSNANVTINNSTFNGNSATSDGFGGAIWIESGNLTVNNSTISGNTAGSGGGICGGTESNITLKNTIVANNGAEDVRGAVTANNSLIESLAGWSLTAGSNNITGQSANLGALANNGGITQTMMPQSGSPAINSGDDSELGENDQIGNARNIDSHVDIGAVESNETGSPSEIAPSAFTVNTPTTEDDGNNSNGKISVTITWSNSSDVDHYEIVAKAGELPSAADTSVVDNISAGTGTATFEWNAGDDLYVAVVAVKNGQKTLCKGIPANVIVLEDGNTALSSEKAIAATSVGTLTSGNITDVPSGTKVSTLKAGLTVSSNATAEILTAAGGTAVADQANTDVIPTMVIKVTAEDGSSSEYSIGMATVTAVILDSGSVIGATAGDTKITDLTAGKIYTIIENLDGTNPTVMYTTANGTLTSQVGNIEALSSEVTEVTEVTGLTNGKTYKVMEGIYFIVTSISDHKPSDTAVDGSLRKAMEDAPDGSNIIFANNLSGQKIIISTPTETDPNDSSNLLSVTNSIDITGKKITITGPSGGITISGDNKQQIFSVESDGDLTLSNLILSDGTDDLCENDGGGAIFNGGILTINNSTFKNNVVTWSSGGAIYNKGTLTINNSTFTANSADGSNAAAVYAAGSSVTINNSTFTANSADGDGGAIYGEGCTLTINNSTISGNTTTDGSGGGIGISQNGTNVILKNTIVSDNVASLSSPDILLIENGDSSLLVNYSLISTVDGYTLTTGSDHNITGQSADLNSLDDNGGLTQTIMTNADSPVIDAGDDTGITPTDVDQRGVARIQGNHVDIGAVESSLTATKPVVRNAGTTVIIPDTLAATSNKAGCLYLVLKTAVIADKASLDAEVAANRGTTVTAVADTTTQIPTTGLIGGTYVVYAVDEAENVSAKSGDVVVVAPQG